MRMLFWIASILILAVVAATLVLAMRQGKTEQHSGAASDIAVYRDQLREVERDLARGALSEADADSVRVEISRRLLDADRRAQEAAALGTGQRWWGVGLIGVILIGGTFALYTQMGAPGYPDLPMEQRLTMIAEAAANRPSQLEAEAAAAATRPEQPAPNADFQDLMDRLRGSLAERPNDVRGLMLLAENEARLGNFPAARAAQERVIALKDQHATDTDYILLIDIMVFGTGGYVSPEAETLIREFVARSPQNGAGQYYAGLALVQTQRPDLAFPIWRRLLENSPPNAPWVPIIQQEIAAVAAAAGVDYRPPNMQAPSLPGPSAEEMAAASEMDAADRQAMIEGMVEGLAARLAEDGGSAEEWARLITALGVLNRRDQAVAILEEARLAFAQDSAGLAMIEDAAARAGIAP